VYTNAQSVMSTYQSKIAIKCINGIRFISMTWVILIHTFQGLSIFIASTSLTIIRKLIDCL